MYTYAASGPILTELRKILEYNGIGYEPAAPSEEKAIGFIETGLGPEEILPYLEVARGCEVRITPLSAEDVSNGNVRHRIRSNYADMGYISEDDRRVIRSTIPIKTGIIQ